MAENKQTPEAKGTETSSSATDQSSAPKGTDKNKSIKQDKSEKNNKVTTHKRVQLSPATVAWISLIVILLAGAAGYGYWNWYQSITLIASIKTDYEQVRNELGRLNGEQKGLQGKITETLASNQQVLDANQQQKIEFQNKFQHLEDSLDALASRIGNTTSTWMLAEAEYLLSIANNRILMERDITTGIAALNSADQVLKQVGDPALLGIREQIANEINELKSVNLPDVTGLFLDVASLSNSVQQLPIMVAQQKIKTEPTLSVSHKTDWSDFIQTLWADVKGLMVIRHNEKPITPLLPPDQRIFLYQNLRLKLEMAQLAMLRRDTVAMKSSLSDVQNWLDTYFEKDSPAVQNLLSKISALEDIDLKPVLPDISGSLRALRQFMSEHRIKTSKSHKISPIGSNTVSTKQKEDKKDLVNDKMMELDQDSKDKNL